MKGRTPRPPRKDGRSAGPVDPDGLEPSSSSLQGRCTATCALGPESAGQESNLPCRSAWVTARCRPTTATRGNGSTRCRAVADVATIDPFAGDLFNFQGAVGATRQTIWVIARRTRRGAGNRTLSQRVWRPPGYRCLAPRLLLVVMGARNEKSRLHQEAALKRSVTCDGPVHTDESTPMGRSMFWPAPTCESTRDVREVASPSFVRSTRSSIASSYRIDAQYMNSERRCEETEPGSQRSCGSSDATGETVCATFRQDDSAHE